MRRVACDWALEFAKDRVQMLFHDRQTQPGVIGNLLVAPALADKLRNFLFAPCQPDKAGNRKFAGADRAFSGQRFSHLTRKCGPATPAELSCFT